MRRYSRGPHTADRHGDLGVGAGRRSRPILTRLKHDLRPLRPILRPIWVRVARPRPVEVWDGPALTPERRNAPIRVLTGPEFEEVAKRSSDYYSVHRRRGYMSAAATEADRLIQAHGLKTALELGPHLRPLIVGADVMDLDRNPELETDGRFIKQDATKAPWPFEDKAYDLFVALQVFEHLVGKQQEAFREVRRVARHAVISLPIDWVMKDPANCHHMISHERALSWFAPVVPTRVEVGTRPPGKRLIYVFEDLAP